MWGNTTAQDRRGQNTIKKENQVKSKLHVDIFVKAGRKRSPKTRLYISHPVYSPQFLRVKRGWFVGSGSGVVTSSPAAAICPLVNASYRSSWFTTAPLKTIIYYIFILMYLTTNNSWCQKYMTTVYTLKKK